MQQINPSTNHTSELERTVLLFFVEGLSFPELDVVQLRTRARWRIAVDDCWRDVLT